jgi:hypothetical protein
LAEPSSRRNHPARVIRIACAFAFAASVAFDACAGRAAACVANPRDRVFLAADTSDPDVFVWDDRFRLTEYALGRWGDPRSVMVHTVLAHPGTRAVVLTCLPGALHPKYSAATEDAIRVTMLSGPYRGRSGWVAARDVHPER